METLVTEVNEQWVFWIVVGVTLLVAVIEFARRRSWGMTLSILALGFTLAAAVRNPVLFSQKFGEALNWVMSLLKFGGG